MVDIILPQNNWGVCRVPTWNTYPYVWSTSLLFGVLFLFAMLPVLTETTGLGRLSPSSVLSEIGSEIAPHLGNDDYEETRWLDSIQQKASKLGTSCVFLTAGDSAYSYRFEELLSTSVTFFPATPAVVTFDMQTYEFFSSRDIPALFIRRGTIPERLIRAKFNFVRSLLTRGLSVFFSEMDVYWRSFPRLDLSKSFLVSQHKYSPDGEVNIGFYFARSNPEVLQMFDSLVSYMSISYATAKHSDCGGFDQKLVDLVLRGTSSDNAFVVPTDFSDDERACFLPLKDIELLTRARVVWGYVEADILEHWPITHLSESKLAGVHLWSGSGDPAFQFEWALQNFLPSTEQSPSNSSAHRFAARK